MSLCFKFTKGFFRKTGFDNDSEFKSSPIPPSNLTKTSSNMQLTHYDNSQHFTCFKEINDTQGDSTKLAVNMDVTEIKSLHQNWQTTEN